MISEIAAWLFTLFIIDPLHAEVRQRVEQANLPIETLQQSRQCISAQAPRLLERAGNEPVWAVGTAIGIATGWTSPVLLLDTRDPNCSVLSRLFDERGAEDARA